MKYLTLTHIISVILFISPVTILAQDPDDQVLHGNRYLDSARFYENEGMYDSAIYYINLAIQKDSSDLEAFSQRMVIHMILEQYPSSLDDARYILRFIPEDLTAIYCLAISLMETRQYDESIRQVQQGIELAPDLAAFYSLMSRILMRKGEYMESGIAVNRAIELTPDEPGNYLIKAENSILEKTDPALLIPGIYPSRFRLIRSTELSSLDKYVSAWKHPYYHKTLNEKFNQDYRALTLDEWFIHYYGQTVSDHYAPYARHEQHLADSIFSMVNNGEYTDAAFLGEEYLKRNPGEISIYYLTGVAFLTSENFAKAEDFFYRYQGFISALLATGDGTSPESAYIVISTNEEYTLMEYLGLRVSGQMLTESGNQYFDVLTGITRSGEEKQVYFNIDKPFRSLDK